HYDDRGSGDTVLLIHGGLMDPMSGERFWITPGVVDDLVGAGYRTLVPDRRYHAGRTTAEFSVATWDVEADDMAAVLNAAGVERARVVAGSNGCSVAIRLARRHSDLVTTLALCWPARLDNEALQRQFDRSAGVIEASGTDAYLTALREQGLPRLGHDRPGFPYGVALLRDERLAASFLATPAHEAARIVRESAAALLPGELLRGVTRDDLEALQPSGITVAVIPADPEDPYHPREAALDLARAIPDATVANGSPVTPSPAFTEFRRAFRNSLTRLLSQETRRGATRAPSFRPITES
ncbi:MAG: alpha/beta hydrolase, partial [Chloroflexota bacterium]|nr:alpha/beta hydrolase [Chloroflexota bacterium]